MNKLYVIGALVAFVAYVVTFRLRQRDRIAITFLAILVALTLTALFARANGDTKPTRLIEIH